MSSSPDARINQCKWGSIWTSTNPLRSPGWGADWADLELSRSPCGCRRSAPAWIRAGGTVLVMSGAPVHIVRWDEDRKVWLARRDGEPSFAWVQSFADAYLASCLNREADLIVPAAIYAEWAAAGDAPPIPPRGVVISPR